MENNGATHEEYARKAERVLRVLVRRVHAEIPGFARPMRKIVEAMRIRVGD